MSTSTSVKRALINFLIDNNYYVDGLTFTNGILTASVNGALNQSVDLDGRYITESYTHPTGSGDDIDIDSTALTGAKIISNLNLNITTDNTGHVTDANAILSTRSITLNDLGFTGDSNANYYTHPTGSGYNHIPSGGASGNVLTWENDGTAVWAPPSGGGGGYVHSGSDGEMLVGSGSGIVPLSYVYFDYNSASLNIECPVELSAYAGWSIANLNGTVGSSTDIAAGYFSAVDSSIEYSFYSYRSGFRSYNNMYVDGGTSTFDCDFILTDSNGSFKQKLGTDNNIEIFGSQSSLNSANLLLFQESNGYNLYASGSARNIFDGGIIINDSINGLTIVDNSNRALLEMDIASSSINGIRSRILSPNSNLEIICHRGDGGAIYMNSSSDIEIDRGLILNTNVDAASGTIYRDVTSMPWPCRTSSSSIFFVDEDNNRYELGLARFFSGVLLGHKELKKTYTGSGSIQLDLNEGNIFEIDIIDDVNIRPGDSSNLVMNYLYSIIVELHFGIGPRDSITWHSSVNWDEHGAPDLPPGTDSETMICAMYTRDEGNTWIASHIMNTYGGY